MVSLQMYEDCDIKLISLTNALKYKVEYKMRVCTQIEN